MSVMVITGASSGIGRALALRAARAGYDVVAIGRNRIALDALAESVEAERGRIVTGAMDISDPANARALVAFAIKAFGSIDMLVNNAGAVAVGPLVEQSDHALRVQFGTHVIGPLAIVREALPFLRASHGQVFMVGSGVARVPIHGLGAYAPSKAAVRSATAILRRELKPEGIAVTYVDPGVVGTPFMTRAGLAGAPPSLVVTPEEVARKILIAVATRPRVVNAVPWQSAFVGLAEFFPTIADAILERNPSLVGIQAAPQPALEAEPAAALTQAEPVPLPPSEPELPAAAVAPPPAAPVLTATAEGVKPEVLPEVIFGPPIGFAAVDASATAAIAKNATFDDAIEPVRRRMERVRLGENFVRDLLQRDAILDPAEISLRWAGMPNKNERAATIEVLDALTNAGFLAREADRYRVLRPAN